MHFCIPSRDEKVTAAPDVPVDGYFRPVVLVPAPAVIVEPCAALELDAPVAQDVLVALVAVVALGVPAVPLLGAPAVMVFPGVLGALVAPGGQALGAVPGVRVAPRGPAVPAGPGVSAALDDPGVLVGPAGWPAWRTDVAGRPARLAVAVLQPEACSRPGSAAGRGSRPRTALDWCSLPPCVAAGPLTPLDAAAARQPPLQGSA